MSIKAAKTDEYIASKLKSLYRSFGYLQYRVNKFEEYDLYMQNKSFLPGKQILTFSDTDGRLMALKPDVTLSIIKNNSGKATEKLCYAENVYRVPKNSYGFREIMQAGLECIGIVDAYATGEVIMLAAESLKIIDADYVLDVSDMAVISGIFAFGGLEEKECGRLLKYIGEKNVHGLSAACRELKVTEETERLLKDIISISGPIDKALPQLKKINLPRGCLPAVENLCRVNECLKAYNVKNVNLDFSVVNDMNYYNGIVFKGFINKIPFSVLSGGRYDSLMARMGKDAEAIGFAVYLDQIEAFMHSVRDYDADVLIIYGKDVPAEEVAKKAAETAAQGKTVRVQREAVSDVRARETVIIGNGDEK